MHFTHFRHALGWTLALFALYAVFDYMLPEPREDEFTRRSPDAPG